MFGNLGFTELLFIFVIALIFFGPRKLPELGKSLGETLAGFKRASEDFKRSWEEEVEIEKKRTPPPAPVEDEATPVIAAAQGTVPAASIKTETIDAGTESENESSKAEQTV